VVVLSRHLYDQVPSIRSLDPSLPPCLDRIVKRMTRKRRTDRFGSTRELTGALCDAIRDLEAKSSLSRMARCA
jgi:hypothetical protein